LKPDEIDLIHQAKAILTANPDNPPSLMELARQVGLNDWTLKRGFRQVFGTTAFGYLHEYRLEQACQLLQERRLNVSEIARVIGFSSCSYLSRVFRKKYGVSPKRYQSRYKNSV
jgi:AraC-like DNA-binding protein